MAALVKGLLYLASILLLGAGVTGRFVLPAPPDAALTRRLRWGALAGAAVLMIASALDVLLTLQGILGFVDAPLVQGYLANTRHGRAVLVRLVLVVAVTLLTLRLTGRQAADEGAGTRGKGARLATDCLLVLAGVALLGTFSWTSHAAAMGGTPPLLADLIHFAAAGAWAGPLVFLALHPNWGEHRPALTAAFGRVSRIGMASVLALFATGTYTALIHMQDPARFVTSPYGLALGAKLVAVLAIVTIAALNRFVLLPRFLRGGAAAGLRRAIRWEAGLLVVVLLLTGALTTSALPHDAGPRPSAVENLGSFLRFLTPP